MANDARSSGPRTLASSLCAALFFTSVLVGACSGGHRGGVGGAGAGGSSTLTIAGSDTMVTLGKIENDVEVVRSRSPTESMSNGAPRSWLRNDISGRLSIVNRL